MFRSKAGRVTKSVMVLLAVLAPPAIAQAEAPPGKVAASHVEKDDVRLVHLDILVTDRGGRPVTDLTAEDFEVLDEGDPVEISHFAPPSPPAARPSTRGVETPSTATVVEPPGPSSELPLLVFYFDGLHLTRDLRQPVLEALDRFLWAKRFPLERVMVYHQLEEVQMLAPFGSSADRLAQAVEAVSRTSTSGEKNEDDREQMINSVFSQYYTRQSGDRQRALSSARGESSPQMCRRLEGFWRDQIQTFAEKARSRGATTLDHLRSLNDRLGGLPGAKVVVYVSGGLEIEPAADVAGYVGRQCLGRHSVLRQATRESSLEREFKSLVLDAGTHRVTFYTLEAGEGRVLRGPAETGARGFSPAAENQLARTDNPQTGLTFLADETGGRAVLETNRFDEPLRTLAEDLDAYYALAYRAPEEPDGREHRVEVNLRDSRNLVVRYRRSYRNVDSSKTLADLLISALRLGWEDNPLGIEIEFGDAQAHPENEATYLVPLRFTLPLGRLGRLEEEEGGRARLRFLLAARDERDRVLGPLSQHFDIALPDSTEGLGLHTFELMTEMFPGKQDLALGFVDEHSGVASFLTGILDLPAR